MLESPIDYAFQDAKQMAFFLSQPTSFQPIFDELARHRGFPYTFGNHVLLGLGFKPRLSVIALMTFAQQFARLKSKLPKHLLLQIFPKQKKGVLQKSIVD